MLDNEFGNISTLAFFANEHYTAVVMMDDGEVGILYDDIVPTPQSVNLEQFFNNDTELNDCGFYLDEIMYLEHVF